MRANQSLVSIAAVAASVVFAAVFPLRDPVGAPVRVAAVVGPADIGGTVTGPKGPAAGVWVIAESSDLPTKFVRIVVTDDQGRYLIPELPKATYSVWVRGHGLVDSPKRRAMPGTTLALRAVRAPNGAATRFSAAGTWS